MEPFNSPVQGYEGWNVNQSYMTPSYMSNFRPGYNSGGRRNAFAENRSVASSLYRIGPGDDAWGSDALQNAEYDRYNAMTGAADSLSMLAQHVAIPASAWMAVSSVNKLATYGGGKALGYRAGALMGRSTMGMMGLGGGTMASMAGGVGGLVGGFALPLLAAQTLGSAADTALVDPYVSTRRGMDAMKANTANQFVFGQGASTSGGFGMSAARSQEISQALTVAGQKDLMLGGGDYNEIADNMMRAGIFQEVGDMDTQKIVSGVKKATSVLKLIQRITGDPDIKNGIQTLATLKSGGLDDIDQMGKAVNQLRASAAASGVSLQQLMGTVGNQGAVMAQQQGMTATSGLLASTNAFAGFTNARRAGIISGTEAARLGGAEGMTQNLMSGAYQVLNSGFGRMAMQGGGFGNSMVGTLQGFGQRFARDPMRSQGDWFMNKGVYMEDAINKEGPRGSMMAMLKSTAASMGLDSNSAHGLSIAAQSMGMSSEQFRSMALADRSAQNPLSGMNAFAADRASTVSTRMTELQNSNRGLRGIPVIGDGQEMYNELTKTVLGLGAEASGPLSKVAASLSDSWSSTILGIKGIEKLSDQAAFVNTEGGQRSRVRYKGSRRQRYGRVGPNQYTMHDTDAYDEIFSRLNSIEASGGAKVSAKANAIRQAVADGDISTASRLYRELDNETKGYLTNTDANDFERESAQGIFTKALKEGLISTESELSMDSLESPTSSMRGELLKISGIADPKTKRKAVKELMKSRKSEMVGALGILPGDLAGKSTADIDTMIFKKALTDDSPISEIDTGSVEGDTAEFMKRFTGMGYSDTQISNAINRSGRSLKDHLRDQNEGFFADGDVREQTLAFAKSIDETIEATKKAEKAKGSNTDWSSMRDITSILAASGDATDKNTNATRILTQAMLNVADGKSGVSLEALTNEVIGDNPNEALVKGVQKSTNVPRFK